MEHYVTLFDKLFLPQGLALHQSLQQHAGQFTLWVLCVDQRSLSVLSALNLHNVNLIPLSEVETPDLMKVKQERSRGEYCWTLTPLAPKCVFDRDAACMRVTYLDADTWLVKSPATLFDDFVSSGKGVLITEHAYSPEYDQSHVSGRFCVQFMTFDRLRGEGVRTWWAERCIEWCFARSEDGKFGDQKYLDDWPTRFANEVHVARNQAAFQAPWNASRFPPEEAVLYHFHSFRLLRKHTVRIVDPAYDLPLVTRNQLYAPYLLAIGKAVGTLQSAGLEPAAQLPQPLWFLRVKTYLQVAKRHRTVRRRMKPIVKLPI